MGSVQSSERCPRCGGYMFTDYYYHTGEEYRFCQRCGISQNWTIDRDENGVAKRDDSGYLVGKYSESGGYGLAYIEGKEHHIGGYYPLTGPLSEQAKEDFLKYVKENDAEEDSYLVTFDPETGKLTQVFGKMPPDFDDEPTDTEDSIDTDS